MLLSKASTLKKRKSNNIEGTHHCHSKSDRPKSSHIHKHDSLVLSNNVMSDENFGRLHKPCTSDITEPIGYSNV
jgi:hypothetical protein